MLRKFIYKWFENYRNPSLKSYYTFLLESDKWHIEKLQAYQYEKCKEFLSFADRYSPYYKELFKKIDFTPDKMLSLDEIKKIPVLDKQILIEHNSEIHTHYPFKKRFLSETSGTSGQILKFYRNEEWDSHHRASMLRGHAWYGLDRWEHNGYLWGYDPGRKNSWKMKLFDFMENRFRNFSYDDKQLSSFIQKLRRTPYLHGYSSMIYETAKYINNQKRNNEFSFKMVKGTSEKIHDAYQGEIKKAFGLKMISEYGSAESGIIAYECPEGNMHINMESVIVEEENGQIIITNLISRSFPIIRYRLGDIIKLADVKYRCPCGREHPVLLDIVGRLGKVIEGKKNHYPSLTLYYIFKNLALNRNIILNYQVIQNTKGKLLIKIEQEEKTHVRNAILEELNMYFHNDIDYEIYFNQSLKTKSGKRRDFITTLN